MLFAELFIDINLLLKETQHFPFPEREGTLLPSLLKAPVRSWSLPIPC